MKERSRTEYSLINIFTGFLGYGINTVLGFVCRIIFVRCLSADYLGVSGLFSNILTMLSLAELGISSAIIYALYKPIAEKDEKRITSLMHFYAKAYRIIGVIVAVVGLSMLPFLNIIIRDQPAIKENLYLIYLMYLANTVISYFFSYRGSLLTAMQRNYIVVGYSYVITIVQSIIQMIFLLVTHEYLSYLIIQMVGGIIYNVWISHKACKDYPYIKDKNNTPLTKRETKDLLKDVKSLAIYKVTGVLVNNTDNIVITYFNGLISVGLASNYLLFSGTLNSLVQQTFNALTGSVGNLNATATESRRYSFFKALNLANFWLYGWGAIGIAFVSGDLVKWFYGANYVMSLEIPVILAVNFYMIGMQQAVYTFKNTLGLFKYGLYILIFTAAINLSLDIILGKSLGIFGIYMATAIARLFTNTWYEPYAVYKHGLHQKPILYLVRYIGYLVVLTFVGVICFVLCGFCNFGVVTNVVMKIVICSVIPNVVFIIVFWKTEEFQYLFAFAKRFAGKIIKHQL